MIKKQIVLCFVAMFLGIANTTAQKIEGRISYKGRTIVLEDVRKETKKLFERAKDVKAILEFNQDRSFYSNVDNIPLGSGVNFSHIMAGGNNKYYTENTTMQYLNSTLSCDLLGECFLVANNKPKWELTTETKVIQGYTCYKATLTSPTTKIKSTVVWYAPKLPYSYGIMDYYGLPGIVLEYRKKGFVLTATKIEINPIEKIEVEKPKENVKKVTAEEFKKMTRRAFPMFNKKKKKKRKKRS